MRNQVKQFLILSLLLTSFKAFANSEFTGSLIGDCRHNLFYSGTGNLNVHSFESYSHEGLKEDIEYHFTNLLERLGCSQEDKARLKASMQKIECLETEVRDARVYCEFTDEKIGKFQFVKEFLTSNNRIYMIVSHWD